MSWVTDVLLLFSLEELFDEDDEEVETILPLHNINSWLAQNGWGNLDNLDDHVHSSGKAMQACVYGGAFNFLSSRIDEFVAVVELQAWRKRQSVQLLIKDEQEDQFRMYTLSNDE